MLSLITNRLCPLAGQMSGSVSGGVAENLRRRSQYLGDWFIDLIISSQRIFNQETFSRLVWRVTYLERMPEHRESVK